MMDEDVCCFCRTHPCCCQGAAPILPAEPLETVAYLRERLREVEGERERLRAALERMTAENTRLRKALMPFGWQGEIIAANQANDGVKLDDAHHFRLCNSYAAITVGDVRRAAEAFGRMDG